MPNPSRRRVRVQHAKRSDTRDKRQTLNAKIDGVAARRGHAVGDWPTNPEEDRYRNMRTWRGR
eukprot:11206355-Lingulodinium_polyedra.AAC.1